MSLYILNGGECLGGENCLKLREFWRIVGNERYEKRVFEK